jgi:hypothetical protein
MDWKSLAPESPYRTAVAVGEALRREDVSEARAGVQELIDALSRFDKRAPKGHLARLMAHAIKWRVQPENRSRSWAGTIANAGDEIADLREETSSLTRPVLEAMWERCFRTARRDAEGELGRTVDVETLSWAEVFEADYQVEEA